jgi:hypothetical protein
MTFGKRSLVRLLLPVLAPRLAMPALIKRFVEHERLEWSIVPVPANPQTFSGRAINSLAAFALVLNPNCSAAYRQSVVETQPSDKSDFFGSAWCPSVVHSSQISELAGSCSKRMILKLRGHRRQSAQKCQIWLSKLRRYSMREHSHLLRSF